MIVLNREDWGADPSLPRLGDTIDPTNRTEVFVHHTVLVDNDVSKNAWETMDEVRTWMQRLQTIRPDLGLDVPYNMVAFCMSDGGLTLCEGRGLERVGAHATNHNRSALGIAFQGNFEAHPPPSHIDSQLDELADWLADLRANQGFIYLGDSRPEEVFGGRQVWGHRDAPTANTLCPGQKLYDMLSRIRFVPEEDEFTMDKPTWKLVQRALQAQEPPLYGGQPIDGVPGRNTNIAVKAFERRLDLQARGVLGTLGASEAGIWPATRELLFATAGSALVE